MNHNDMSALVDSLVTGDQALAVKETQTLLAAQASPERILAEGVEAAMAQLDAKCTAEQFNLLEIMLAGRAVMGVMKKLYPADAPRPATKATVVLASLEGDIHDLGKNIVATVLTARGYRVVDCGKDCPVSTLVEAVQCEAAAAVGISGLISSIVPIVQEVRQNLRARNLERVRVMAGGAALKQASPEQLNVDFVGATAFDCLHYLDDLAGEPG